MSTRPGLAGVGSSGTWTRSDPGLPGPQQPLCLGEPRPTLRTGPGPRHRLESRPGVRYELAPAKSLLEDVPGLAGSRRPPRTNGWMERESASTPARPARPPSPVPLPPSGGRGAGKVPSGTSSKGCTPIGQCVFIWLLSLRVTSESVCRASLRCGLGVPQAAGV